MFKNLQILFTVGLISISCAHQQPIFKPQRPYPKVESSFILEDLKQRKALFHHPIRLEAKIEITFNGKKENFGADLLVARPSWLFMEAPTGTPIGSFLYLSVTPTYFQQSNLRENTFVYGESRACALRKVLSFLPQEFEPSDLVEILLGSIPLFSDIKHSDVDWDGTEGGKEVLILHDSRGMIEKIWLSAPLQGNVVKAVFYQSDNVTPRWTITHENFQKRDGFPISMPKVTTFINAQEGQKLVIKWKDWEFSPEIQKQPWQAQFQLAPSPSAKIERFQCFNL